MPRRFQTPVPDHLREPSRGQCARVCGTSTSWGIGIAIPWGLSADPPWIAWRLLAARFFD